MKYNTCRVRITGISGTSFINVAQREGIKLSDIEIKTGEIEFECEKNSLFKVKNLAIVSGATVKVIRINDKRKFKLLFAKNAGLVSGIILFIAVFVLYNMFVCRIEINGDIDTDKAMQALSESGYNDYIKKSDVDLKKIEEIIAGCDEDIAYAEAYLVGNRVIVNTKNQIQSQEEQKSEGAIYAECDAIISRIEVSGGTAVVKEGQTVFKGDKLIDDVLIIGDVNDPAHKEVATTAEGTVYGRVWYSQRLILSQEYIKNIRSGNTYTTTSLYINDKCILQGKNDSGFLQYESESIEKTIRGILPIRLVTTTYYETKQVNCKIDESYIDGKINETKLSLISQIPTQATILKSDILQKKLDNLYIINIYYEVEQQIGCKEE